MARDYTPTPENPTGEPAANGAGNGSAQTLKPRRKAQPRTQNGKQVVVKVEATAEQFAAAVASEAALGERAAAIRGEATRLTAELFMQLWPLLREPIPEGFLQETTRGEGKPYDSKGIRSVQVCTDRMDVVLTPLWWHEEKAYHDDGKLCEVTVIVDVEGGGVRRSAWGGVNRGSTQGNLYKGSYTNAGKRAYALLGVGHEIYLGATDFDPDVDPAAAAEQTRTDQPAADSPLAGVDPAEMEARADAFACAKEIIAQGIWNTQRLKAEMVSAKAADTSTVGKGIASIPFAELQALHSRMVDLLPPVTDEPTSDEGEKS